MTEELKRITWSNKEGFFWDPKSGEKVDAIPIGNPEHIRYATSTNLQEMMQKKIDDFGLRKWEINAYSDGVANSGGSYHKIVQFYRIKYQE